MSFKYYLISLFIILLTACGKKGDLLPPTVEQDHYQSIPAATESIDNIKTIND